MGIEGTAVMYALVGFAVATAYAVGAPAKTTPAAAGHFVTQLLFWPLFAPVLLGRALDAGDDTAAGPHQPRRITEKAEGNEDAITHAEAQLMEALDTVGGVADELLGEELDNIHRLSDSLAAMQRRIAEMDALLESDEFDAEQAEATLRRLADDPDVADDDERIESVRARLRNIQRLHNMRRRARQNLDRAVLKMEEMASQILLLRFADHPEDQIAENIHDIASTIDGLSEGLLSGGRW